MTAAQPLPEDPPASPLALAPAVQPTEHHIQLPDLRHLNCRAGNHPKGTACAATGVHHGVRFSVFWWPT